MATPPCYIPLLLASCGFLLLLPNDSTAQSIPFDVALEGSVGMSRLRWPEELPRTSYLPTLTVNAAATSTFFKSVYLQPFAGLQFDAVRFSSPNDFIEYKDHYAITSFRTGLFVMARDDRIRRSSRFVVGLGLETQRPIYVRSSVYSRAAGDERTWVRVPDPPELEQWGLYWTLRLGTEHKRTVYALDLILDNEHGTIVSGIFPKNPLVYTSLRFSLLTRLSDTNPR